MKQLDLYLDIGNTSIDILECEQSLMKRYSKFYKEEKKEIIYFLNKLDLNEVYISSVNKKSEAFILKALKKYKSNIHILDREIMKEYGKKNKYTISNIDILGSDLFCDLVACKENKDYIIIDLGTVSKVLAIDSKKKFLGGMIVPGITSFSSTITSSTDLNLIGEIKDNLPLLNFETDECVSSGSVNGLALMLIGVVEKIKEYYNLKDAKVMLTGGNSKYLLTAFKRYGFNNFDYSPKLVLLGLGAIFDKKIREV